MEKKKYIDFEPNQTKGYPRGKNIYYECLICGEFIESQPKNFAECSCENIVVDVSGGRLSITDHNKFKIFQSDSNGKNT